MAQDTHISPYSSNQLASLGEELSSIGLALIKVSTKLKKLQGPKLVRVTPKSDPDMFTKEFVKTVRKSLDEIKKGKVIPYEQIQKELNL